MNELKIFENAEFGKISVIEDTNGKVFFCANEIATALGYKNTQSSITRHCQSEGCVFHAHLDNRGAVQNMRFISEGNVYRLIAKSKLPAAVEFESWIFDNVLPSIRKHGMYAKEELLNNPDFLVQVAMKIKEEQSKNFELSKTNECLKNELKLAEPKLKYIDDILNSELTLTATQIAADYGISATKLNRILAEERVHYKVNNQWVLYAEYKDKHLTDSYTHQVKSSSGDCDKTLIISKWTQKGRLFIHNILIERGYITGEEYGYVPENDISDYVFTEEEEKEFNQDYKKVFGNYFSDEKNKGEF